MISKNYEIDLRTFCRSKSVENEKQEKKTDKDGSQDRHCLVLHVRFAQLPDVGGEEVVGVPVEEAGHAPVHRLQTKKTHDKLENEKVLNDSTHRSIVSKISWSVYHSPGLI